MLPPERVSPYTAPMFQSVLAVLLFGMMPVGNTGHVSALDTALLEVASPSPLAGVLPEALKGKVLTASGLTVVDLQTAQILYARDANTRRPIASLTKLMTAILIVEHHDLDEWVTVPKMVSTIPDTSVRLAPGHHLRVGELLTAMLVSSSNDAAYTLSVFHSGSEASFAVEMNERAKSLGLIDTSFANATGFDSADQWSTARDVANLAAYALNVPELRSRMSLSNAVITSREGARIPLEQTHQLLKQDSVVTAGKTGTTDAAGQCLMSVVHEGDRDYLVVLLSSRERYRDMQVLLSVLASLLA